MPPAFHSRLWDPIGEGTWPAERTTTKRKGKVDAALKAKVSLEALRGRGSMAALAQRCQMHSKQIYA